MTDRTEQIVREAPQIEAYKLGLLQSARQLADQNVQLPVQQIAGMTELQRAALQQAGAGIGDYIPYLTQGGRSLGAAERFMTGAFGPDSPYGSGRREALGFMRSAFGPDSPYGSGRREALSTLRGAQARADQSRRYFDQPFGRAQSAERETFATDSPYNVQQQAAVKALQGLGEFGAPSERERQAAARTVQGSFGPDSGFGQGMGTAEGFLGSTFGPGSPYGTGREAGIAQIQRAASELPTSQRGFDPRGSVGAFFDPYQQQVVDQALGDVARQGDIARQRQRAEAVSRGAFGGSRGELAEQELNRNILEQQAQLAGQLRSQGYQQSLGQAQQAFEQQQQRAQQAQQLRAGFGRSLGDIAGQAGQLGIAGAQTFGDFAARRGQQELAAGQALGALAQQRAQTELARAGQLGDIAGQTGQLGLSRTQALGQLATQGGQFGLDRARTVGSIGEGIGGIAGQAGQLGIAGTQALGEIAGQAGQLGIAGAEALGTLGLRQAALGELGQQMGQRESQFLFDVGKLGQAQQQAELEALRQSQLAQIYEPYQRVSFLSDIYKGAPSSQMSITGATAPQASPAQQLLGLGIAGLSAYGGAQRAGLFG